MVCSGSLSLVNESTYFAVGDPLEVGRDSLTFLGSHKIIYLRQILKYDDTHNNGKRFPERKVHIG